MREPPNFIHYQRNIKIYLVVHIKAKSEHRKSMAYSYNVLDVYQMNFLCHFWYIQKYICA